MHQLPGMGQPALVLAGLLIPGVAELDVNPIHPILRRQKAGSPHDVEMGQADVVHRVLAVLGGDVPPGHPQHRAAQIHRQKVDLRGFAGHLCRGKALAAAQFHVKGLLLREKAPPLPPQRQRVLNVIRTGLSQAPALPIFSRACACAFTALFCVFQPRVSRVNRSVNSASRLMCQTYCIHGRRPSNP